jgi:hypothetical protein
MPIENIGEKFMREHKPIIISDDSNGDINGFSCKRCNRTIYGKFTDDSIWCNSCSCETIIGKDTKPIKRSLKAEVVDNTEVFVASLPGVDPDSVRIYGPTQYQGGFKTLHDKGTLKLQIIMKTYLEEVKVIEVQDRLQQTIKQQND